MRAQLAERSSVRSVRSWIEALCTATVKRTKASLAPARWRRCWRLAQLAAEPRAGGRPVAFDRLVGDLEKRSGFFDGEAAEIPELHDLRLARTETGQAIECSVEGFPTIGVHWIDDRHRLVEGHAPLIFPAALFATPRACVFHQNLPHHVRGDSDELRTIVPYGRLVGHEMQVGLMNESRRLQRMSGPLATQIRVRQPPQLVVNGWNERVVDSREASRSKPIVRRHHSQRTMLLSGWQYDTRWTTFTAIFPLTASA